MARGKKGGEEYRLVVKPGDRIFVSRTAVLLSKQLSSWRCANPRIQEYH